MTARAFALPSVLIALFFGLATNACSRIDDPVTPLSGGVDLASSPATASTLRAVYSFGTIANDGAVPFASLIAVDGLLYGTTSKGGSNGNGTIFSMSASGKETVLHSFGYSAGPQPNELLFLNGSFYGTTRYGGTYNEGAVFRLSSNGTLNILHSFSQTDEGGVEPVAGLTSFKGKLYGTTSEGGQYPQQCYSGCGAVFAVTPSGAVHVLHQFDGTNGGNPVAAFTVANGALYGVLENGGKSGSGSLFKMTPSGKVTTLFTFNGYNGAHPDGKLVYMNGRLLGTSFVGGSSDAKGTLFSVDLNGKEQTLHVFSSKADGCYPEGLVAMGGQIYGTTVGAMTDFACANLGAIYRYSSSSGFSVLHTFSSGKAGANPFDSAGLTPLNGKLYGTAAAGGKDNMGTVFSLLP
jgi:uncharacterized repeat protein (TIGR03803 family)